jgi:hypothetical protein
MLWLVNKMHDWLVVWKIFFHMLGIIIPTDELIFFRGVGIPPTRWHPPFFSPEKETTTSVPQIKHGWKIRHWSISFDDFLNKNSIYKTLILEFPTFTYIYIHLPICSHVLFPLKPPLKKQKTPQAHLSSWLRDGPRRCGWEVDGRAG